MERFLAEQGVFPAQPTTFLSDGGETVCARFLIGICIGVVSFAVSPVYCGICSAQSARRQGGAQPTGYHARYIRVVSRRWGALASGGHWPWMLGLGAVPGLILAVVMIFPPESPRWLMKRGRTNEVRQVLTRTRVRESVEPELRVAQQVFASVTQSAKIV